MKKKVAVIGAGWAGAAAAWQLHKNGHHATVFEASHTIGGRARKHNSTTLGQVVDNGQHLLLGAYSATLKLMQELGIETEQAFYRFDLDIHSADNSFRFKTAPLPAPFHLLGPLFTAKGLGVSERLTLIRLQSYLIAKRWQVPTAMTVHELLVHTKQPPILIDKLWIPLCIAALNTPIEVACAQLFANVLRDSLGGSRQDTQMLIPLRNMSDLWAQSALQYADVRLGQTVRKITPISATKYRINAEADLFDALIIATNAPPAARLLKPLVHAKETAQQQLLMALQAFEFNPIATLYLQPESAWDSPYPMQMLEEDTHGLAAGQWVFNHAAMPGSEFKNMISVTISYANRLQHHSKELIMDAITKQVNYQAQTPLPPIIARELITEKRATFVAKTGLERPQTNTPWRGIQLAGDWVQNEYPAVLEGAVRSGIAAANAIDEDD